MKRFGLIIAAFLICGTFAKAQNFRLYSFGESELSSFNPASMMEDGSEVYGRGSYDWYSTDLYAEKPYDFCLGGHGVGKWGGVSAQKYFDQYSYFIRHGFQLNYAYQWRVGENNRHHFSIGAGLSMAYDHVDMGLLKYDEGIYTDWSPDFNIGFEYANENMRTGFGGVNLLSTPVKVNGNQQITRNPRVLLAYFIYRFDIKDAVGISPLIYVGYCEKTLVEVSLRFDYRKIIAFSYGFRAMDLRHVLVMNFTIPKTPLSLDLSYTTAQFYKGKTLSFGFRVNFHGKDKAE